MIIKTNIGAKIVIYISYLVIVICTVLGFIAYNNTSITLKNSINSTLNSRAEDCSKMVSLYIESQIKSLQEIASRAEIKSMIFSEQKPILIKAGANLGFSYMSIVNLNKTVKVQGGQEYGLDTLDVNIKDSIEKAFTGIVSVSNPTKDVDGKIVISIATSIKDDQENVKGVVIANLNAKALNDIISSIKLWTDGYGFIIDKTGTKIAHKNIELAYKGDNDIEKYKNNPAFKTNL